VATQNKISVLIVDDHPPLRAGIRTILEKASDIYVVGEAGNSEEAKNLLNALRPKIILLDLIMPDFSPSTFEKWVRENYPETITLVLTAHGRDAYLATMMDAGATGYLDKEMRAEQLIHAIRRAASGELLFDEEQIARARHWHKDIEAKWNSLTKQEHEVLRLAGDGLDNKHIARKLFITTKAIEKHLTNVYQKLEVTSRAEAIIWWNENGRDFPT
jgi:NarL family two-component system response regulator LiaR